MRSFFVLAAILAVGLGLAVAAAPAAGQETATNETTPTPNATGGDIQQHEFEESVDRHVTVKSWEYNTSTEQFIIEIHADQPSALYISEVVSLEESGSQSVNVYRGGLDRGDHTIRFAATPGPEGEAAAILQTRRSQVQGDAVILSTGQVDDELPLSQTSPTTGWLGGITIMVLMVAAAGVQRIRSERAAPEEIDV